MQGWLPILCRAGRGERHRGKGRNDGDSKAIAKKRPLIKNTEIYKSPVVVDSIGKQVLSLRKSDGIVTIGSIERQLIACNRVANRAIHDLKADIFLGHLWSNARHHGGNHHGKNNIAVG